MHTGQNNVALTYTVFFIKSLHVFLHVIKYYNTSLYNTPDRILIRDSCLRLYAWRVKDFVDKQTLLSVYNAIVRPYFDYCCEVWDVFGKTQSKRLQKLQNRAARLITNMTNDVDHSLALQALGWETLEVERKKAKAKMIYKLLNNMGPHSLTNLFTYKGDMTNYI